MCGSHRFAPLLPVLALAAGLPAPAPAAPGIALSWSATTGTGTTGGTSIDAKVGDVLTLDMVVTGDVNGIAQVSTSLAFDPAILTAVTAVECPSPPNLVAGACTDAGFLLGSAWTTGVGNPSPLGNQGDFDVNGGVGSSDFALFYPEFGLTVPPGNPLFDLNNDTIIGLPDSIIAFANSFGFPGSAGIVSGGVEIFENFRFGAPLAGSFTLGRVELEVVGAGTSAVDVFFLPTIDGVVDGTGTLVADSTNPSGATITAASVTASEVTPHVPSLNGGQLVLLAACLLAAAWFVRGFVDARVRGA